MNFDDAFHRIFDSEGEYVNNPNDPGGETKYGISKHAYPSLDIKNITEEQAKDIYYRDFWFPLQGDHLPDSVCYQLFDFAINSGISTAIRYFQKSLGVADDGHIGPITRAAMAKGDDIDMIVNLLAARLQFMTYLSNWESESKGWARRIARDLRSAVLDTKEH